MKVYLLQIINLSKYKFAPITYKLDFCMKLFRLCFLLLLFFSACNNNHPQLKARV